MLWLRLMVLPAIMACNCVIVAHAQDSLPSNLGGGKVLSQADKLRASIAAVPDLANSAALYDFGDPSVSASGSLLEALRKRDPSFGKRFVTGVLTLFDYAPPAGALSATEAAAAQFALVEVFDYQTGRTDDIVVELTTGKVMSKQSATDVVPPLADAERLIVGAILSRDETFKAEFSNRLRQTQVHAISVAPADFGTPRAALVRFKVDGEYIQRSAIVDLANERVIQWSK